MKALVVGGSGSIGQAIVENLLDDGFEVILTYHRTALTDLQDTFKDAPVQFLQIDLTQQLDCNKQFEHISNVDVLIYVSGHSLYGMLQDMIDKDIDDMYRVHVYHLIKVSQYFLNQLIQSPNGRIIVISSIWGETGASFETIYSTMKAAQIGFVKALSEEVALTPLTVNAIAPGIVEGRMTNELDEADIRAVLDTIPQQRLVHVEEVAHACRYLISPYAKSVTGTVQRINGGWHR
ncbi:SDR family oxidoreductase [Staphylococcus agnetis]|uniref:elongation factor P 5-aminopentanone reductase n=1 Tax=Staphylococcus agnetis TaxID=985762 RepID=UPI00208F4878|nr:SDR family oxidoreductase [Staphylococcus agnetis]MCO4339279.1 SDR family oxidoreductase [Staphylococcus agnetis]MCO4341268.1 SDR family oxidoreductase [Staphylococcus agnetis]MCO4343902.1 SDR family oxidoreductase [Staphylococcus agnetis]MCO4348331.1 SDR family oxidoreductase [Staphylococcus agnetis]MCO4350637.1 SDR family oxidoreductase [Staphylococcus agnetis]